MGKRRFESFEVFLPRILATFKISFSKKWEKHRAHTLSTRKGVNILSVRSLGKQLVLFSLDFVSGNIRARGKTKLFPQGPDIYCFVIFLDFHFNSDRRITGTNQNSRLGAYGVFSHDVTAAILVSQNNETAAMLVSQTNPLGVELFSNANAFFCSNKFA